MLGNITPQSKSNSTIGGRNTGQGGIRQVLENITPQNNTGVVEVLAGNAGHEGRTPSVENISPQNKSN